MGGGGPLWVGLQGCTRPCHSVNWNPGHEIDLQCENGKYFKDFLYFLQPLARTVFPFLDMLCDIIYFLDVAIQSRTAYLEEGCLVSSTEIFLSHMVDIVCEISLGRDAAHCK